MMKFCKYIGLLLFTTILVSCADPTPPPQTFNQFLYNKSSMTKQLESLDNNLTVLILYSGMQDNVFKRITSLNLSNRPVIIGLSQAQTGSPDFVDILKHADTTPIGKILFAPKSGISRDPDMQVEQVYLKYIADKTVKNYMTGLGYTDNDIIYKRTSIFRKDKQTLQVIEYILPSIHAWLR